MTPDKYTLKETMLAVGDGHELYIQLWGNADAAETFLFLHGGPGSGCGDKHKALFDPEKQRVIFFDQRGSGKSRFKELLQANDTDHLIEDINRVTTALKVDKFVITGGSWGCCLALAYAIRYPERVTAMVLRGIFTGRQREIEFYDKGRFIDFFPDAWQRYSDAVPVEFREDPGGYHIRQILGKDSEAAKRSAYAYSNLAAAVISLEPTTDSQGYQEFNPNPAIIECYYTENGCFLPEGYILDNTDKLTMPIQLVQGRYDMICPPITAFELSSKLKDGQLHWTLAGHSGGDKGNHDRVKGLLALL